MADGDGTPALGFIIVFDVKSNKGMVAKITQIIPIDHLPIPGLTVQLEGSTLLVTYHYETLGVRPDQVRVPDGGMVLVQRGNLEVHFARTQERAGQIIQEIKRKHASNSRRDLNLN